MSRGIWKIVFLGLLIFCAGISHLSCTGTVSNSLSSSPAGGGVENPTNIDTPHPSGQGTQEGHGTGDLAVLRVSGTLSENDSASLSALNVTKTKFVVGIESGEDPNSSSGWTPVGNISAPSLSLSIFSATSHTPPPHLDEFCVQPYLRLTAVYEVATGDEKDPKFEFFKSLPVIQKCPIEVEVFQTSLPLVSVCHQCEASGFGKLEMNGTLGDEDSARLSQSNVTNTLFEVNVESGLDPDSDQWTPMGSLQSSKGLSVAASDEFGSLAPHLSDFCLYPFLRVSATYEVEIQTEKGTDKEFYTSHNLIQECPAFMDTVSLSFLLQLQTTDTP